MRGPEWEPRIHPNTRWGLAHGSSTSPTGKTTLAAHYQYRIIFSHIAPGDQIQPIRRGHGCCHTTVLLTNPLDDIPRLRADEHQEVIQLLRTREHNPLVLHDIMHFHLESRVHLGVYDQPRSIEGVTKDLVERKIPRAGFRLIGKKDNNRLRGPLFKLHLSRPRPHAFDVS